MKQLQAVGPMPKDWSFRVDASLTLAGLLSSSLLSAAFHAAPHDYGVSWRDLPEVKSRRLLESITPRQHHLQEVAGPSCVWSLPHPKGDRARGWERVAQPSPMGRGVVGGGCRAWAPHACKRCRGAEHGTWSLLQALFEVITSEATYLRSLGVAVSHFRSSQPLQAALAVTELHQLFSNLPQVKGVSDR